MRRSAIRQILTAVGFGVLLQRPAISRTLDASPAVAWTVHLGSLAVLPLALWLLIAVFERATNLGSYFGEPAGVILQPPYHVVVLIWGGTILGGVVLAYVLALMLLCLAHRDEPLGDTWRHALRTVRMTTPSLLTVLVLIGAIALKQAGWNGPVDAQSIALIAGQVLLVWCYLACLVRAVGVDRPYREVQHEPLCESCGYLLVHLSGEARCPECGTPAAESLDSRRRQGGADGAAAYQAPPAVRAWLQADLFFAHLPMIGGRTGALWRVVLVFAMAGGTGWFVFLFGASAAVGDMPPIEIWVFLCFGVMMLMTGLFCAWLLGGSIVGLIASRMYGRNLLHAAFLVAANTAVYFVIWAFFAALANVATIGIVEATGARNPFWFLMGILSVNVAFGVGYIAGVWRRVGLVRYANWDLPKNADVSSAPSAAGDA